MYQNTANLEQYLGLVTKGELPVLRAHRITEREKIARTMVNGVKVLRLSRKEFLDRHGVDLEAMYGASIRELVEEGLLEIDRDELRVPRAKYVFADDICRHFFLPEHRTMMTSQVLRSSIVHDAVEHAASSSP
jgi:oxygen-independent coproporphyrinogen-3 oxidase